MTGAHERPALAGWWVQVQEAAHRGTHQCTQDWSTHPGSTLDPEFHSSVSPSFAAGLPPKP